ncbi:nitrate reductase [Ferrimonas marina]|uniref:Assimilatory nitrate reductase catalytic subunit n=1 Tax=Ferrimonas marina TaxID=299255 RepID=A0A1M5ZAA1_9GAMM|nr:nitrate reductase [Ferrimonas marina]SHI21147.1 assimilatory nitrate reductase catalytic subunit [Ferrimonas marina]
MAPRSVHTTCPYCGVGCGVIATAGDAPTVVGDPHHRANFGKLCSKGLNLADTLGPQGRLTHPMVRGERESWPRTIGYVAQQLQQTIDRFGPDSVAFYVSGQLLTEDYYVANKLMKGFIGSGNIDTNSRLCMSSAVAAHKRAFGSDTVAGCYQDLELADLVILTGSNLAWCHPVLYQRILAAKAKRPQMKLVVIDPRRTASCHGADLHLPIKAGGDTRLFNGLLHFLRRQGKLTGLAQLDSVAPTLEQAARAGSVAEIAKALDLEYADLLTLFQWFAQTDKVVTVFSQGINQSDRGVDQGNAILNCHLASGKMGFPGAAAFSITGQPNAMGGREVGGLANTLAAHMEFGDEAAHQRISQFWQTQTLARQPGLTAVELFDAVRIGRIQAVWVMGTNPAVSLPDAAKVRQALKACPLVVVSDCVAETDTVALADVVLPAQGWGEKDGTVTNSERRISRQRGFMTPVGEAKPDWWIVCQVAKAMGFGHAFDFDGPAAIFREHAALSGLDNQGQRDFDISALARLTPAQYNALVPLQWPQPAGRPLQLGDRRLFEDGQFFTASGRARLVPVQSAPSAPRLLGRLRLNSGRWRDQWHTMTRTARATSLNRHAGEPAVQCHPTDAQARGLQQGQLVALHNELGEARVRLIITDEVRRGELFLPLHWSGAFASQAWVNDLVTPTLDPISRQPAFKQSQVSLKAVTVGCYASVLCAEPVALELEGLSYWARQPVAGGQLYHLADERAPEAMQQWLHQQLGAPSWQGRQGARRLGLASGQNALQWAFELAAAPQALLGSALASLLAEPPGLATQQRLMTSPPRGPGQLICSCRNVTEQAVQQGLAAGEDSVGALMERTGAGLGCGSCQGDLDRMLRCHHRGIPRDQAS